MERDNDFVRQRTALRIFSTSAAKELFGHLLDSLGPGGAIILSRELSSFFETPNDVWIDSHLGAANGTSDGVVLLQPSDAFLNALATLRAVVGESAVLNKVNHGCSVSNGAEP